MSKIEVMYYSSEYDCCGSYFSVGEYIWWQIDKVNYNSKIDNKDVNIKYSCTNCSYGGDRFISGKINKIIAIHDRDSKSINCKETMIDEMHYSYLVTLENVEEYLYNEERNNLKLVSNPCLNNTKLLNKKIYSNINIIGDMNDTVLSIAKKFNENNFGINFYSKDKKYYKKMYNNLKTIRSCSNNEYCAFGGLKSKDYFLKEIPDSLTIIMSDKKDYLDFYDALKKEISVNESLFNICYVHINNNQYDIDMYYLRRPKNIFDALKYINFNEYINIEEDNKLEHIYICESINAQFNNEQELVDFLYANIEKNINYNNKLFYNIMTRVIRIIAFIFKHR